MRDPPPSGEPVRPAVSAARRTLLAIAERALEGGALVAVPGEGTERALRSWLIQDYLTGLLGWPSERVWQGERFDVLLRDAEGRPVITIETKAPGHRASHAERRAFQERLPQHPTLRTAFLTDARRWERLDLDRRSDVLLVDRRSVLEVATASDEEFEAFLLPLDPHRYASGLATVRGTAAVRASAPHVLHELATAVRQAVADLVAVFRSRHRQMVDGTFGPGVRRITAALLDLWCTKSLIVSVESATTCAVDALGRKGVRAADVEAVFREFAVPGLDPRGTAERLIALLGGQPPSPVGVENVVREAYAATTEKLFAQSAHVVLARCLLYRIGEDASVFDGRISGDPLEEVLRAGRLGGARRLPATEVAESVRRSMQEFLPAVYQLGEFDWWVVPDDERATLGADERASLDRADSDLEVVFARSLRVLNTFDLGRVDVDVWRNVYQDYLPPDERQRLGGFYTPDELVDLTLDAADYRAESAGLCELTFIDPACGSGAFVTAALGRLLRHLDTDLPCHGDVTGAGARWKRAAAGLRIVASNLHAVDIHPFAAFLTTVNALFLVMPRYVEAREHDPAFSIDFRIFSADSLDKHERDMLQPDLFARLNSRVQLSQSAYERYREVCGNRFALVFGNPPWGGVLKGPLAPVYDDARKACFATEFPMAATGKYDVYGLFIERALQMCALGGRIALVTQNTWFHKEWAAGLRRALTTRATVRVLVDIGAHGQLFFRAMNTPAITVADAAEPASESVAVTVVVSRAAPAGAPPGAARRAAVADDVRAAMVRRGTTSRSDEVATSVRRRLTIGALRASAARGWNLLPETATESDAFPSQWPSISQFVEHRQGVTPGGCLEVFLLTRKEASRLRLEDDLVHGSFKSRELERWCVPASDRVLLYPYVRRRDAYVPAFRVEFDRLRGDARDAVARCGLEDALDFDRRIDRHEEEIVRTQGVNGTTVPRLLQHRVAMGLVPFPATAAYLIQHYDLLEGRVFKKRNIRDFSRTWYEYLWPRDGILMRAQRKLATPTLVREARFVADFDGRMSDHATVFLVRTPACEERFQHLRARLADATGRHVRVEDVFLYLLAFLNSRRGTQAIRARQRPTPKGSYTVSKTVLERIRIAPPAKRLGVVEALATLRDLVEHPDPRRTADREARVDAWVERMFRRLE